MAIGRFCNGGQTNVLGPVGSGQFGSIVQPLPNGNIVAVDSTFTNSGIPQTGAVYLYNFNLQIISVLTGSHTNDHLGSGGITILSNGNYVVNSPDWNDGLGAVTWCSGISGCSGAVSNDNSLVGTDGEAASVKITPLPNGNYIVNNPYWHGPDYSYQDGQKGAVTCCSGVTGFSGTVSSLNSLVGDRYDTIGSGGIAVLKNSAFVVSSPWAGDGRVSWCSGVVGLGWYNNSYQTLTGSFGGHVSVLALPNTNYLVINPDWNYLGLAAGAGAVTWCSGTSGYSGDVYHGQSVMGGQSNQQVGAGGVVVLANGNYLVVSPYWDSSTGAVTWCSGTTGRSVIVGYNNSLTGCSSARITPLANGNYVIYDPFWSNGSTSYVGAVSFCFGNQATSGAFPVSPKLAGVVAYDEVGSGGITALTNGNYVVCSQSWSNGLGATTWCSGATGRSGTVSNANSLVGSRTSDHIGSGAVVSLANGNYIVCSPNWSNGLGAVTWCLGAKGTNGLISTTNSLVGRLPGDHAGLGGVTLLANSNYVVCSPNWSAGGAATNAGAITWCDASLGLSGVIAASNSLVGNVANDAIGSYTLYSYSPYSPPPYSTVITQIVSAVTALPNGNFVVESLFFNLAGMTNVGAITWGDGTAGVTGVVSAANSLVGSSANDRIGSYRDSLVYYTIPSIPHVISFSRPAITPLPNGNYIARSPDWDNGTLIDAGAVTWRSGWQASAGLISGTNSLIGSTAQDKVGNGGILVLTTGNYVVISPNWNNGALTNVGAISWCNDPARLTGLIAISNSVLGDVSGRGANMGYSYDYVREGVLVGRPWENLFMLLFNRLTQTISFPPIPSQWSPGSLTLAATSSAGLPVNFSVLAGPATLNGNELSLTGPGRVTISAFQPGDATVLPAPPVTNSFNVTARAIQMATSSSSLYIDGSGFHLQVDGLTSQGSVIIYDSTNLADWRPLFTNPPVTGSFLFLDTNANGTPARYYRASEQ